MRVLFVLTILISLLTTGCGQLQNPGEATYSSKKNLVLKVKAPNMVSRSIKVDYVMVKSLDISVFDSESVLVDTAHWNSQVGSEKFEIRLDSKGEYKIEVEHNLEDETSIKEDIKVTIKSNVVTFVEITPGAIGSIISNQECENGVDVYGNCTECKIDSKEQIGCGLNGRGSIDRMCLEDGKWSEWTECTNDPDVCIDGTSYRSNRYCAGKGNVKRTTRCISGHWGPQNGC